MDDLTHDSFYTRFSLGADDRVRYQGLYYRPWPTRDGYRFQQEGGDRSFDLIKDDTDRLILLRALEVDSGFFTSEQKDARALEHALAAADLPLDVRIRTRKIVTFLDGYRKGKYKKTKDGVEQFYKDFDETELSFVNNDTGGTPIEHYTDKNPIKWRQFLKLVRHFVVSGRTANSLVRNYRGSSLHEPKFTPDAERFVEDHIARHADKRRPSGVQIVKDVERANKQRVAQGLPMLDLPRKRTIQRRIAAMSSLWNDAGRRSEDEARLAYQMSFEGPIVTRPLQRVEMDEKYFDLILLMQDVGVWGLLHDDAKEKILKMRRRLWLSVAFDYASRSVLAMRLLKGAPNSRSAVETLQMAVQSKEHITRAVKTLSPWPQCGRPEWVYTDSGASWRSNDFQDAVYATTGNHCKPPARNPHLRGAIERFFKTMDDRYMQFFTGRTFSNVLAKGKDYDPTKVASLTFDELAYCIVRMIVDCYHNTAHDGLGGQTPLQAWAALNKLYEVKPFESGVRTMIAFGVTVVNKSIGPYGIVFAGIPYGGEILQQIRDLDPHRKIDIRVNLSDLSRIWMRSENGKDYVELRSIHPGLEKVSFARWASILKRMENHYRKEEQNSWHIVEKTIEDMRHVSDEAIEKASIGSQVFTSESLARLERKISKGRVFARQSVGDYGAARREATDMADGSGRRREEPVPEVPKTAESILGSGDASRNLDPDRFANARAAAGVAPEPPTESSTIRKRAGRASPAAGADTAAGIPMDGRRKRQPGASGFKNKNEDK
ncbi:DDE-type integrase/transposase/recombinase [Rhizobium leguminosarum]|uniref:DDE-type integrase/transposase/recombinase n=1 Tax=Rhizobium leguminosarum TaxID=384 RepID=UPI00103C7059|nr:DDE-type integrase/transposase/recombinase [Rhizobium leguminosarum]TBZ99504.1 hypothetical protein E0H63_25320 [Rhizobium leguminosarum bv. viciae]